MIEDTLESYRLILVEKDVVRDLFELVDMEHANHQSFGWGVSVIQKTFDSLDTV